MDNECQRVIFIVIPALNEGGIIGSVIKEIREAGYFNVIVIDDGSFDDTFEKAKRIDGVIALKHFINRGKGAAAKTGIEAARLLGADIVITMDGDGQHNPQDILGMINLIESGYDVVLGTRLKNPKGMPWHKIIANHAGNFFTWVIYGLWVTDSQSGFRAYSKRAVNLIDTKTDRYEYDSEVICEIYRHKLKFIEIPVKVRYTKYSIRKKNKMNVKNGIKTLVRMLLSA